MPDSASSRTGTWITLLVLLILAGTAYFLLNSRRATVTVRTAPAEHHALINAVATMGRVEPIADFQAHAPMASVIDFLPVHLGQHVSRGQELLRLDASDAQSKIAAAQAQLAGAQNTLHTMVTGGTQDELLSSRADLAAAQTQQADATQSLATLRALQAKGAASANEVTAAQQKLSDAQVRVQQLRERQHARYGATDLTTQQAQVNEARSALTAAQSGYAGLDIHSPIGGTVYDLPYVQHDFVPAGGALISVADLNHMQVRAYFDEPEIGKLAPGEPVTISWDARPNQLWHGRVTQAPTNIVTYNGTRNVGVCLISIDDAHGELIPNINVTVRVTTSQHFNVLSVPREALHTEGSRNYVFRVQNGRLVRTPVIVREGDVNLTRVGISSGLDQGDVVALSATTDVDLADGMRVRVQ